MFVLSTDTAPSIDIEIYDDSGIPVTGLVAATIPTVYYSVGGATAKVAISLSDLAAETTTWSAGGLKERGNGVYRLDLPTAAINVAGRRVRIFGYSTGKNIVAPVIDCGPVVANTTQLSGTAQTARDIGASVLLSSGTGTGQLSFTSGVVRADVRQANGNNVTTTNAGYLDVFVNSMATGVISAQQFNAEGRLLFGASNFISTATTVPVTSGSWTVYSGYLNRPSWLNVNGLQRLWYDQPNDRWVISASTGALGTAYWTTATGAGPDATYTPGGTATGVPDLIGFGITVLSGYQPKLSGLKFPASIAAGDVATDAINGAAVKADAVTKIQSGLATPTNITGGTITNVTNLANSPSAGDLTATMKTSVALAVQSGMTSQGYTTTRGGYLDTLNNLVSAIWSNATRTLSAFGFTVETNPNSIETAISTTLGAAGAGLTAITAKTNLIPANPAAVGSQMDLVNTPNASARTAMATTFWGLDYNIVMNLSGSVGNWIMSGLNQTWGGVQRVFERTDRIPDMPASTTNIVEVGSIASPVNVNAQEIVSTVWSAESRTLTGDISVDISGSPPLSIVVPQAIAAASQDAFLILVIRGDTLRVTLPQVGSLASRLKLILTVKANINDGDSQSVVQIVEGVGLTRLNGNDTTLPVMGALTVRDEVAGEIDVMVDASVTAQLAVSDFVWDLQVDSTHGIQTPLIGTMSVVADVTRAVT